MTHEKINRALTRGVILGTVAVTILGTGAWASSPATTPAVVTIPGAGVFDMTGINTPSMPDSSVRASVESLLERAEDFQADTNEAIDSYDLGRATTPSTGMEEAKGSIAETLAGLDADSIRADTSSFLFSQADLTRSTVTPNSNTIESHVPSEAAEGYLTSVESAIEQWESAVGTSVSAWESAVQAENTRIEEEETRLRAEEEARRLAEERAAAARVAAQAAAQANATSGARNSGSSNASSGSSSGGGGNAPAATRPSGESASQRVNRLMGRLGVSVPYSFQECNIARAMGCYITGTSSIRITALGLSKNDFTMCRIILHEFRHLQQNNQGLIEYGTNGVTNAPWLESDANNYAASRNNC